jgi:hypothetical protein
VPPGKAAVRFQAQPALLHSPANLMRVIRGNFSRKGETQRTSSVGRISDPSAEAQRAKAEA